MLEEMQLFCLMLLLVGHGMLIRGCTRIGLSIPASTHAIGSKFDDITDIGNELADLIHEIGSPQQNSTMPNQVTGGSIPEMLTGLLLGHLAKGQEHGPKENQRTIYEINPTPQEQTENESHELGS